MLATELNGKVKELRELKQMAAEIASAIEDIQDEIKAEMVTLKTDILKGVDWKITWKEYQQARLDTKRLEADLGFTEFKRKFKHSNLHGHWQIIKSECQIFNKNLNLKKGAVFYARISDAYLSRF